MASIKIRLDKKLAACRDPQEVIPQMNRISKECKCSDKTGQTMADELYSYMINRFDTLQWAVFTHRCIDDHDRYRWVSHVRCTDRYSSFSHALGTHYESDCFLDGTPCFEAIAFPLDTTFSRPLFDEHTFKDFLKEKFVMDKYSYGGKLNYIALQSSRSVAVKSNSKVPYFRLSRIFKLKEKERYKRTTIMGVAPQVSTSPPPYRFI